MNVLVTGASGALGSAICVLLAHRESLLGPIPPAFEGSDVVGVSSKDFNVADPHAVKEFFLNRRFDIVFHCAAMTDVDGCESQPDRAWGANALGAYLMAEAARRNGARFVSLSTDFVFDGTGDRPLVEDDPSFPCSVYGETKLAGERLVLLAAPESLVVRTAWLHGSSEADFPKAILRVARDRGRVEVVDDQVGSPSNALDVADALLRLAAANACGIVHCANRGFCSRYDLARAVVADAGLDAAVVPVPTTAFPRPARRPAFAPLDVGLCERIVGKPMRSWQEALEGGVR